MISEHTLKFPGSAKKKSEKNNFKLNLNRRWVHLPFGLEDIKILSPLQYPIKEKVCD